MRSAPECTLLAHLEIDFIIFSSYRTTYMQSNRTSIQDTAIKINKLNKTTRQMILATSENAKTQNTQKLQWKVWLWNQREAERSWIQQVERVGEWQCEAWLFSPGSSKQAGQWMKIIITQFPLVRETSKQSLARPLQGSAHTTKSLLHLVAFLPEHTLARG